MRNLTSSKIRRLLKTNYYWIAAVFMVVTALFAFVMHYRDYKLADGSPYFDSLLTIIAPIVFFAIAVFVSLFVGSVFSDGTMRNKIIVGHSRVSVYLSLMLTSVVGGWILAAVPKARRLLRPAAMKSESAIGPMRCRSSRSNMPIEEPSQIAVLQPQIQHTATLGSADSILTVQLTMTMPLFISTWVKVTQRRINLLLSSS